MSFEKRTWENRLTEFPKRRTLTKTDNSTEVVTITRNEGDTFQEGDKFSAENMNDLENRIDQAFTDIGTVIDEELEPLVQDVQDLKDDKVSGFTAGSYAAVTGLAYDATNKKLGLKVGADTIIPFKRVGVDGIVKLVHIGTINPTISGGIDPTHGVHGTSISNTSGSWNISQYVENPSAYSAADFLVVPYASVGQCQVWNNGNGVNAYCDLYPPSISYSSPVVTVTVPYIHNNTICPSNPSLSYHGYSAYHCYVFLKVKD